MLTTFIFLTLVASIFAAPVEDASTKIIGGQNAVLGQFPWQVRLTIMTFQGNFGCGGSVINDSFIATAAHCVWNNNANAPHRNMAVRIGIGQIRLDACSPNMKEIYGERVWIHPLWNPRTLSDDAAMIKLSERLFFNNDIKAISLPTYQYTFSGTCTTTGWGSQFYGGPQMVNMQFLNVPIIPTTTCQQYFAGSNAIVNQKNTCAGTNSNQGVCSGDSGGSVHCQVNGQPVLAGITSFVRTPCGGGYPDVYCAPAHYHDFFYGNIGGSNLLVPTSSAPIDGAYVVRRNQFPDQVALLINSELGINYCGGVIVDSRRVIAAADCFTLIGEPVGNLRVTVVAGWYNNQLCQDTRQRIAGSRLVVHADYLEGYNLAIVELVTPLVWNDAVRPANWPPVNQVFLNSNCWLPGRGIDIGDNRVSEHAFYVPTSASSQSQISNCKNILNGMQPSELCSMADGTSEGFCRGDTGGPLYCNLPNGTLVTAGVLSYRQGGCIGNNAFAYVSAATSKFWGFLQGSHIGQISPLLPPKVRDPNSEWMDTNDFIVPFLPMFSEDPLKFKNTPRE